MIENLFEAYKRVKYIRTCQQELVDLYLKNKIFSMVHFYVGQESVAAGVCNALEHEDKVLGNHRSHGHYLAKGGNFRKLVCELFGRADGNARGKGGSMHMIDKSVNFVGSTPLLGSVAPIAAGVAFEQKYNKSNNITVAFYGDGASEEGVVYESYNIAALYEVPVLFVIENNGHSINSQLTQRRSVNYNTESIVNGMGVKYIQADGNNYEDVFSKAKELVRYIRTTKKPAVLECNVFRHLAHSTPLMEEKFRTNDTLEERLKEDSVVKLRNVVIKSGVSENEIESYEEKIKAEILEDIQYAFTAPYPAKEELYTDVYKY